MFHILMTDNRFFKWKIQNEFVIILFLFLKLIDLIIIITSCCKHDFPDSLLPLISIAHRFRQVF